MIQRTQHEAWLEEELDRSRASVEAEHTRHVLAQAAAEELAKKLAIAEALLLDLWDRRKSHVVTTVEVGERFKEIVAPLAKRPGR